MPSIQSGIVSIRVKRFYGRRALALAGVVAAVACAPTMDVPTGPAPGMPAPAFPIVPIPERIVEPPGTDPAAGAAFRPGRGTTLMVPADADARVRVAAERVARRIRDIWDLPLPVVDETAAPVAPSIRLALDPTVAGGEEAYRLEVRRDGVALTAPGPAGLFYGLQTLDQLVPETAGVGQPAMGDGADGGPSSPAIPGVVIEDAPRFPYRGLHLDVARHFFGVEFVKRYLDTMARYKLNTFHWHLTEDQGWRLEIEAYPRLTKVGGCRDETMVARNFDPYVGDGERYCGYYTQAEAREIVEYARDRFITVVPEIEMPGHSLAALAAYPELACTPGPFEVATRWGVFEDIYCPKETTFEFLETVLTEVMDIFPGPYIHVGGDEAPKARWEESPLAQRVIEREGLADEGELQSWFIGRIERFLNTHGRQLIGWDEILEGGLPPQATVMSWRGVEGGVEAARQGHDVVMTPTSHLYFDYYQGAPEQEPLAIGGFTPLEQVYGFEPVPAALNEAAAEHVIGAQANVWTEYMKTGEHVEYMVYPRLLALSEVVWSPAAARDWDGFLARLPRQLQRLARLGVGYRLPEVRGIGADRLTLDDRVTVRLRAPVPGGVIRYTLDGTEPGRASPVYRAPLRIRVDTGPVTVAARVFADDRAGATRQSTYRHAALAPALEIPLGPLEPGLRRVRVEGAFRSVAALDTAEIVDVGVTGTIGIVDTTVAPEAVDPEAAAADRFDRVDVERTPDAGAVRLERYGLRFAGYLRVPEDAVYTFRLASDDGSALFVDHRRVVDNDGLHGVMERAGQVALAAGLHRLELRFFQAGGGEALELTVSVADGPPVAVPTGWLFHYPRR